MRAQPIATCVAAALVVGTVAVAAADAGHVDRAPMRDPWSAQDVATLASMRLEMAGPRPADASNAYEQRPDAAALGRALFHDARLSRNGQVACASCHLADRQFQDSRQLGHGIGTGTRRTMPLMGAGRSPFLFWDGRKDSAWSQALGPLEDAAEHGMNRLRLVRLMHAHHKEPYEAVFGPLPHPDTTAGDASPVGTPAERAAWAAMPEGSREAVNRAFANIGKSIAAFEHTLSYGGSRFDAYARATAAGDRRGQEVLSPEEVRGLRLFLAQGRCVSCHNGPLLTDHAFHNTGVPPLDPKTPDRGRVDGVRRLLQDEFNCLGRYSDTTPDGCGELRFLATDGVGQLAAFRTPSLRNVAERAPYMHAGQFATLERAVEHYARSPNAVLGHSELARADDRHGVQQVIRLADDDVRDLASFLRTLTGPVHQAPTE